MLDVTLCLLAILCLSVFFTSLRGVKSAAAPLLSLSVAALWFLAAGVAGVLVPAGWVLYIGAAGLCVWAFVRRGLRPMLQKLATPGFLLFCSFALLLLFYLAWRQPMLGEWDEFSFWGSAAKKMTQTNELYVDMVVNWVWPAPQRPGLIMLSYFAHFFGGGQFEPWKLYWILDVLYIACAAAVVASFNFRRWLVAVPLFLCGVLAPFCFSVPYGTTQLARVYLNAYGDLYAGMLLGAILAVYFGVRRAGRGGLWQVLFPLALLGVVKENLFVLALLAAAVMAADTLLFGAGWAGADSPLLRRARLLVPANEPDAAKGGDAHAEREFAPANNAPPKRRPGGRALGRMRWGRLAKRLAVAAAWFAAPVLAEELWNAYVGTVINSGISTNDATIGGALLQALSEIFGLAPKSEFYYRSLTAMSDSYFGRMDIGGSYQGGIVKMSMFGSGFATTLAILLICICAIFLAQKGRPRRRVALVSALAAAGFAAYQFGLFVVYAFFNRAKDAQPIFDYERYLSSYFIGWFLLSVFLLALGARGARFASQGAVWARLARCGVLAVALVLCLRFAQLVRPGYSILDYPDTVYAEEKALEADAGRIAAMVPEGEQVFFVAQGDDGLKWFQYSYYMMPRRLSYSIIGGRSFALPDGEDGVSLSDMQVYLETYELNYILVVSLDEAFVRDYGSLFANGLTDYEGGSVLYKLGDDGLYAPVEQTA